MTWSYNVQEDHLIIAQGLCTCVLNVLFSRALEEVQQVLTPLVCSSLPIKEPACRTSLNIGLHICQHLTVRTEVNAQLPNSCQTSSTSVV